MSESTPPPRPMRWWMPASILLLSSAAITTVRFSESFEGKLRSHMMIALFLLGLLLLAVWYVFFTGLRWRTRWILSASGVGFVIALAVFMKLTLRVGGSIAGNGLPLLVWKWTPRMDAALPELTPVAAVTQIDVSHPGPRDFPQFLGAQRRAAASDAHLARDWSARPPQQLWRQPIGPGWSSFSIVGTCAFTQEQRQENELTVCYDLPTGKALWEHGNPVRFSEPLGGDGPRATPTISDGRVYSLGATGILDCLDGASGKLIWSHDTLRENNARNLIWGKSSSPLICDNLVVVTGGAEGPSLLAYNKDTGAFAWRGGTDKSGYGSPALATLAGKRQILIINGTSASGHDPADGHVLWDYKWPGEYPKCSQPVPLDDQHLFISAGYAVGCVLLQLKPNPENNAFPPPAPIWKNRHLKTQFSNVAERSGFLYGLDDETLVCLEIASGERKWKEGHYGYGQVLLAGDLLLVQAETGELCLVEASPDKYNELARLAVFSSKTWNNPALAGEFLLLRNDREAVCYRLPLAGK